MGETIKAQITCKGRHQKRGEFRKEVVGTIMDVWKNVDANVQ
jgi:hypothetical protein